MQKSVLPRGAGTHRIHCYLSILVRAFCLQLASSPVYSRSKMFALINSYFGASLRMISEYWSQLLVKVAGILQLHRAPDKIIPKSVNYHFTRQCNYSCGFCFHTAKTSFVMPLDEAKNGLAMLKQAGMEKINFSGGEPFLPERGRYLGEMARYCKEVLKLSSVSIVSNGSMIRKSWFKSYSRYVDILAISCDSFHEDINKAIGRGQGNKNHIEKLKQIRDWCFEYDVLLKINTVVNTYNQEETMVDEINLLNPIRWKVFQCLLLEGENAGPKALRDAQKFYIDEETFERFIARHQSVKCLVPESNTKMQNSYLILDEYMRFLDCRYGAKVPSKSILDIGVEYALQFSGFDEEMFKKRGGIYKWSKEPYLLSW